jgi:hypothetical protein
MNIIYKDLLYAAQDNGVTITIATSIKDQNKIAIHLLNPELGEIEDALERAIANNFNTIVLHTIATWPGRNQ